MNEISLSIEETNKLRISLGLSPLKVEEDKEQEINQKLKSGNEKESIDNVSKDVSTTNILTRTKTLGQGKVQSTADFIRKVGRKTKKIKEQKQKQEIYDNNDLEGLKIAHNLQDLPQESILTLRDHIIGEDDSQDELELITLKKPKKKQTTVYEDYEREQMGLEKKMLEKYDEDDDEQGFVLGKGGIKKNTTVLEDLYEKVAKPGGISLDYKKTEMSDFHDVSFKKKKIKKMKKKKNNTELEDVQEMKEYKEFENSNKQTDISSLNFVDDYDLQQSLARSRKKNVKAMAINIDQLDNDEGEREDKDENQVVISDLTEFVETLSTVPLLKQKDDDTLDNSTVKNDIVKDTPKTENGDADMEVDHKSEHSDVDMEVDQEDQVDQLHESDSDEPPLSKGLAGTLSLLSSRGEIQQTSKETISKFTKSPEEILIDVQIKQEFEKYGTERDWPKRLKELESKRERARMKRLESYKPNVELLHRDKMGRELTPKEAFREFAQKFHGVKSGKNKVEKKLKRLKEELEMKKMDGDVAVRVSGRPLTSISPAKEKEKPVKMEKGVIMELPVPGPKPAAVKRKHADFEESTKPSQTTEITQSTFQQQESTAAVIPKREKIAFGFGKTKLAPKKLE